MIRPVGSTGDNYFNYLPIKDFSILNAGSTNIVGGSAIPHTQALYILNRDWTRGSYSTEANVYIYSFGASPVDTITTGKIYNFYRFKGSEQLVLNFPTPLAIPCHLYTPDVSDDFNRVVHVLCRSCSNNEVLKYYEYCYTGLMSYGSV